MTEIELLQQLLKSLDFYAGISVGVLLGLIFWNIAKDVK